MSVSRTTSRELFEIVGGTAVLPDGLLEDARLVVEDGRTSGIGTAYLRTTSTDARIDAGGCWVLPGAVDIHGDGLEQQIRPRPLAEIPLELAIHAGDRLLAAAGVTTTFHAVKFSDDPGRERTVKQAKEISAALHSYQAAEERLVDHFVLHRLDVRMPGSWEALWPHLRASEVPYVSMDDNRPGQGQFRDVERYARRLRPRLTALGIAVEDYLDDQVKDDPETVARNQRALSEAVKAGSVKAASHDDDSPEHVRERREMGCTVAEFPITEEAALTARELGMPTVVGAPNALRGGSTANNVSAHRLLELGVVSALCSDYSPWSMWWAVFRLASEGWSSLERLVRMVTLAPAQVVGLDGDRGAIAEGLRADIVILRPSWGVPKVEATFRGGRLVYAGPGLSRRWGSPGEALGAQ